MLLSGTKFLFAPGATVLAGYNYLQTLLITTLGGSAGVFIFYYFGDFLFREVQQWMNKKRKTEKVRKTFSRRNRLIVKTKVTYGLVGFVLLTPVFLSIPIGSIVAAKFFRNNKMVLPALIGAVIASGH